MKKKRKEYSVWIILMNMPLKLKTYIEKEKNMNEIPLDDIKNINNSINDMIKWIKDNQDASEEDYDKKEQWINRNL